MGQEELEALAVEAALLIEGGEEKAGDAKEGVKSEGVYDSRPRKGTGLGEAAHGTGVQRCAGDEDGCRGAAGAEAEGCPDGKRERKVIRGGAVCAGDGRDGRDGKAGDDDEPFPGTGFFDEGACVEGKEEGGDNENACGVTYPPQEEGFA